MSASGLCGERESSEFKRNLNGGPQADGGGERQLENNKYPQMSQMEVRKRTAWGNVFRLMMTD